MDAAFTIGSDLASFGRTEDGVEFIAPVYFVMMEDRSGNRWRHHARFASVVVHIDDEGLPHFEDVDAQAVARADRLLQRILRSDRQVDFAYWNAMRPAYGSDAYVEYGQYDDWMAEQAEEGHRTIFG